MGQSSLYDANHDNWRNLNKLNQFIILIETFSRSRNLNIFFGHFLNSSYLINWCLVAFLFPYDGKSQPLYNSQRTILGVLIYEDALKANVFYYGPSTISLGKEVNGCPALKYLKMVQSKHQDSKVKLNDFNFIQFKLINKDVSQEYINQIQRQLGGEVILKPLPIEKFECFILHGYGGSEKEKMLSNPDNTFHEENIIPHWREKYITLNISKETVQTIDHWLAKTKQLGIQVYYGYYSKFVEIPKHTIQEDTLRIDTKTQLIGFKNGLIDLQLDLNQCEEAVTSLILNEETLPRYLPLHVSCYDFSDGLSPGLLEKKVTVCGNGLQNDTTCAEEILFKATNPTFNSKKLRFKLPILLTSPLKYRVINIHKSGRVEEEMWREVEPGTAIDITSVRQIQDNRLNHQHIYVKINAEDEIESNVDEIEVTLSYFINGQLTTKNAHLTMADHSGLFVTDLFHDEGTAIDYEVRWKKASEVLFTQKDRVPVGGMIFLNAKNN